ncbi:MAG: hypothetical protein HC917_13975 [Richelia sp. SM2_1_7]|nr:hypothetical protein [Richelia sp. SM2_1_7]
MNGIQIKVVQQSMTTEAGFRILKSPPKLRMAQLDLSYANKNLKIQFFFSFLKEFSFFASKNAPFLLYFYNGNLIKIFVLSNIPIIKNLFKLLYHFSSDS